MLLRLSESGDSVTQIETGVSANLQGDLRAQNETVLVYGADGVLLRLDESGDVETQIETGVTADLWGDLQAQDGSVFIYGADGVILRLSESGDGVTRIETGVSADIQGGLTTEIGSLVAYTDSGDILQFGDALARRADDAFSDIDQILQRDPSSLGANEEPLQMQADRLLSEFLNGLPPHIQDIPDIAGARQELVAIMTRRAVLTYGAQHGRSGALEFLALCLAQPGSGAGDVCGVFDDLPRPDLHRP